MTVVEAHDQLASHCHRTAHALGDAHDVRCLAAGRHEVDHADDAVGGREQRLEDQRVVAVAALDLLDPGLRRDDPAAVFARAEQCCETGTGVEAGEARPVDRALVVNERGGL